MKFKQMADLDNDQLQKKLSGFQLELMKLEGSAASGASPKNPGQIKQLKKSIARVLTALKQRGVQVNG
ncbi:MAG: 50S ribosomal protein L29 [Candidatus Woesearchaeota archaeon]